MRVNVNFLYVINGYYIVMRNDKRIGTLKNLTRRGWSYVPEWSDKTFDEESLDAFINKHLDDYAGASRENIERVKDLVLNAIDIWELSNAS